MEETSLWQQLRKWRIYQVKKYALKNRTINSVETFSDIRISYRPILYDTTKERREGLMKSYHFTCHCHKCQDVQADHLKSSVICKCKGPIPIGKKAKGAPKYIHFSNLCMCKCMIQPIVNYLFYILSFSYRNQNLPWL